MQMPVFSVMSAASWFVLSLSLWPLGACRLFCGVQDWQGPHDMRKGELPVHQELGECSKQE